MIHPPGFRGAVFGTAADGDPRRDAAARRRWSATIGLPEDWAWARQVHGRTVSWASRPGSVGEADAICTETSDLPVVIATADCVPVILESDHAAAVVHTGWRGAAAGILDATLDVLNETGSRPVRGAIGPAIRPCCYEVGADVATQFEGFTSTTTWGAGSVDLPGFISARLEAAGIAIWDAATCTMCDPGFHSYRRDGTALRQTAVAWLPPR